VTFTAVDIEHKAADGVQLAQAQEVEQAE